MHLGFLTRLLLPVLIHWVTLGDPGLFIHLLSHLPLPLCLFYFLSPPSLLLEYTQFSRNSPSARSVVGVGRNKMGRCPDPVCVPVVAGRISACCLGHLLLQKRAACPKSLRSILQSCKCLGVQLHGGWKRGTLWGGVDSLMLQGCRKELGCGAGSGSRGDVLEPSRKSNLLSKGGENRVDAEAAFSKAAVV